jgi:hypothetical protein
MTAIVPGDVLFLLAAPTAAEGYSVMGVAGTSWGGWASTTPLSATALNNLFPDITGAENAGDQVDYACVFVLNNTTSGNSMLNVVAWLPNTYLTTGGATLAVAADPAAASVKAATTQQAAVISSPTLAPSGVSGWMGPSATNSGGVSIGSIAPGYVKGVWIRRTATDNSPVNDQQFGLELDFTSLS